ncbi:MAG: fibronectin type III domain-containing protein, partial [Gammaproteobacteria bacterium AqS3]|nr:fibronectin type III domain-containing protein [Gammaproteobacteria bacterium AqS3]
MISGTPSAPAGSGTMTYTATDSASPPASIPRTISWTISAAAPTQIQQPNQPSVSSISHNSVTVSWTAVTNATGYKVFYQRKSPNAENNATEQTTTSTSYPITGLSASSEYEVWIQALTTNSGYTDSVNSLVRSFDTVAQPLTVGATSFTLATDGLGKIKITAISASDATNYEIQWKLASAATWGTSITQTSNTYTIGNDENPLTNSVSYDVRIRGRRTGDDGDWTTKSITTQTPATGYASNVVNKPTLQVKTSGSEVRMVVKTNAISETKKVEIEIVPVAFPGYPTIVDWFGEEVTKSKEIYTKTVATDTGEYEIITTHVGEKELDWNVIRFPNRATFKKYHSTVKNTRDLPDYTRGMQVQVRVKKYNATTGGESTEFSSSSDNFILSGHAPPPSSENYGGGSIPNPLTKSFSFADSGFVKYIYKYLDNGVEKSNPKPGIGLHTNLDFTDYHYFIAIYDHRTSDQTSYYYRYTTDTIRSQSNIPSNNIKYYQLVENNEKSRISFNAMPKKDHYKASVTINYDIPAKNMDNLPVYAPSATGAGGAVGAGGSSSDIASPTELKVHLIEYNKALLIWESPPETDYHEIEHNGTPSENKTGITGNSFVFEDLPIDSELTFKIKSHAGAVSTDFVDFDLITTGLVPEDDDIPFEFGSDTPLTFSKVNDSRNISYSFEAETEEVDFYQIRYWQSTDGRITNNDYALHDAQYITIDNTHAEGVETFTGTFDPGYSSRYYTAQIRAFVGTATDDYDRGFSAWHDLSNNESIGATTISNVFQNGRTLLTAPALSVEQSIDDAGRSVITGTFTDLSGEWEEPSSPNSTISVDISVVDGATDDYGNIGGIMRLYDTNDIPIVDDGQKPFATKFVFTKTSPAPSVDGDEWNFQINRKSKFQGEIDSNTANIVVDLPGAPPAPIAHVTPSLVGTDVKFTWEAIEGADGYEVSITEPTGLGESLDTSSVVQTSNAVEYVKVGGRNESFSISVRSYSGSANDRLFSTSLLYGYSSSIVDDASIGKVRSLTATADDDSTTIGWAPAMVATAYEYQSLTNEGTWGTSATTADTSIDISSVSDLTVRVRGFAGTSLTNPVFTSTSWSTISYKADTNPDASDVGDIRRLVGISKNNTIALEWDAADNATAYELEAYVSNAWTSVADDVETLAYSTTYASTESMNFRVRGVTDDDDGEWTEIAFTGDASISIDAPSVENHVTYTTINLNWEIVANAVSYDIEYRESTTPVSAWVKAEHSHDGYSLTIDGLKTNTLYNVRVRGTDGTNDSAWAVSNIRTMLAENLSAPSTITLVPTETDFIVSWTSVADATGYRVEISYSGFTSEHDVGAGDTQISFNADDFDFLVRPVKMTARVKSLFHDYDGGVYSDEYEQRWNEPDTKSAQIAATIGSSVAGQASGAPIPVNASRYRYVENAPPNEKAMPYFSDSFETLVCNTGVAIDSYELPYPVGGVQPYTINISNLPNGLVFDTADRTISGTPTDTAPEQGYATVQLIDANNL